MEEKRGVMGINNLSFKDKSQEQPQNAVVKESESCSLF